MVGSLIGSAVLSAGTAVYEGHKQSSAAKNAANSQAQTTADTNDLQWKEYQQTREDQAPWRDAGLNALKKIENNPYFNFTQEDFKESPGYNFRLNEGVNALDRSAASRGLLNSGAQEKALIRYGQGIASDEYNNAFNRYLTSYNTNMNTLKGLAGVGQSSTNLVNQAGQNTVNNMARNSLAGQQNQNNFNIGAANANANAIGGMAQSVNQGIGNYMLYKTLGTNV